MNTYINQIFNEGLGLIVYTPIKKFIDKKIKKTKTNRLITYIIKIIYIILILVLGLIYIVSNSPL